MATLAEARFGKGKLMICSIDVNEGSKERPEIRHLRYSILEYMDSPEFAPEKKITETDLRLLMMAADSD